jgi:hypothetical protein
MQKTTLLPIKVLKIIQSFPGKALTLLAFLFVIQFFNTVSAEKSEGYDAQYHTMHHILDGYSWDFFKMPGEDDYVAIQLPEFSGTVRPAVWTYSVPLTKLLKVVT